MNLVGDINQVRQYMEQVRARYSWREIEVVLDSLRSASVLLVGDTIVDIYTRCRRRGMATKTPTLNCQFLESSRQAGGILVAANHMAAFTESVRLVTVVGSDNYEREARAALRPCVNAKLIKRPNTPTTSKERFIEHATNVNLFEMSRIDDTPISGPTEAAVIAAITACAKQVDMAVVIDFGHGLMTPAVIAALKESGLFVAANAQMNSANMGFHRVTKYVGTANYFSMHQNELRLAVGNQHLPATEALAEFAILARPESVMVTCGRDGSYFWQQGRILAAPTFQTDGFVDGIGAGDAALSITSLLVRQGVDPLLVLLVGNCAGSLHTRIDGNARSINNVELRAFIAKLYDSK